MKGIWRELRRRKVVQTTAVYVFAAWVLLQVGDTVIGLADLPPWTGQLLLAIVVLGLPLSVFLSWVFDLTPDGLVATDRDPGTDSKEFNWAELEPVSDEELTLPPFHRDVLIGRANEQNRLDILLDRAREMALAADELSGTLGMDGLRTDCARLLL